MTPYLSLAAIVGGFLITSPALSKTAPTEVSLNIRSDAKGSVTVTTATPSATIRYTIDGSEPNQKSGPYLGPINLPQGGQVKAALFTPKERKPLGATAGVTIASPPESNKLPSTLVPCTQDRDWPIYDWGHRHTVVSKMVLNNRPDVLFIGDSITQMFGGEPKDRKQPGEKIWDEFYGSRKVVNLGFGFDYVENALWRLQNGELKDAKPKAIVLMIGTNNTGKNTAEEIVQGIQAILKELQTRTPQSHIILMGIFPRGEKPNAAREKIAQINTALASLDTTDQITYVDITQKLLQPDGTILKSTMGDFLHPTAEGYQVWAEAIEPILGKLLSPAPKKQPKKK